MRKSIVLESEFINKNKGKWKSLERNIQMEKTDFLKDFNELSDDAAFAQTYYKNRSVRVYLNYLLGQLQGGMLNKRGKLDRNIGEFWKKTIPTAMYHARFVLLISFVVFIAFCCIGYYSASQDSNFVQEVFGEQYVTQTIKNIEEGDPMAVYKKQEPVEMFIQIAFNNIRVGLFAFAMGCLFGIGSLFTMVINGVMIGAFMYFFYSRGLSTDFNLAVWMHGTFEIAMLVIEAAAGFVMGLGLINRGTLTTTQSFYLSSRKGIHILIATLPFTIFAAVIESFITRFTEIPNWIRASFIISCLLFTLYYFVIYPILLRRRGKLDPPEKEVEVLEEGDSHSLKYLRFKLPIQAGIRAIGSSANGLLRYGFVTLLVSMITVFTIGSELLSGIKFGTISGAIKGEDFINMFTNLYWLPNNLGAIIVNSSFLLLSIPFSFFVYYALRSFSRYDGLESAVFSWKKMIRIAVWTLLWFATLHMLPLLLAIALTPLLFSLAVGLHVENGPGRAIANAFRFGLFKRNSWVALLTSLLVIYLIAYLLHSPLFWTLTHIAELFYIKEDLAYADFTRGVLVGMTFLCLMVFNLIHLFNVAANYLYNREVVTGKEMEEAIDGIEVNRQILGFEVE